MGSEALIVRQEGSSCRRIGGFLAERGYSVTEAGVGTEAVESYRARRPDVVLLDVLEPGNGGLETLRGLRALDPQASVIMVSCGGEEEAARQVLAEGAYEYITRPVDWDYLELALLTTSLVTSFGEAASS